MTTDHPARHAPRTRNVLNVACFKCAWKTARCRRQGGDFGMCVRCGGVLVKLRDPCPLERFVTSVLGADYCWPWRGERNAEGYGVLRIKNVINMAHRWAYEMVAGQEIPAGTEIDHLCQNKSCVNPAHLQPVSHRENVLRSHGPSAVNARKTHCYRGHAFTPENTMNNGRTSAGNMKRRCRECDQIRKQEHRIQRG